MKKPKNIWLYFIKMFLVFMVIFFASQFGMLILESSFTYLKYGPNIIAQSIWAVLTLIVVYSFKNSYIFKEEKEKLPAGLKLGWPLLVIALIFLLLNIVSGIVEKVTFSIPVILNLATYCLLIGIVEEFLCRGWLLNEFLERFSNSKKNIITSIVMSSLIFGFIHIFNLAGGQSLVDTLVQVVNATFLGIAFALIYYKTKNIWSVVLIHAIWDFCLMLGSSTQLVDCVPGTTTNSIIMFNTIYGIIIVITNCLTCYWLYKQTDLSKGTKKLTNKTYYVLPIIVIVLYIGATTIEPVFVKDYYICPTYESKDIGDDFETQYYYHSQYTLDHIKKQSVNDTNNDGKNNLSHSNSIEGFNFALFLNSETYEIEFENRNTGKRVILTENGAYDYLLLDNEDSYTILIYKDFNKVLYGKYSKEDLNNEDTYMDNVKNQLKEYIVPEIDQIGSIQIGASNYKSALIVTTIYDKLYFDETGNLYVVSVE